MLPEYASVFPGAYLPGQARFSVHPGDSIYSHSFAIRSVFPLYACHFYLLVGLNHFLNPYLTERIITCLVILWIVAGFARLSKALGKNGIWGCFFVLPFLANWPLYMGFTNFALGTATLLFAVGYWLDQVTIGFNVTPHTSFLFFIFVGIELIGSCVLRFLEAASSPNPHRLISYLRTLIVDSADFRAGPDCLILDPDIR